MLSKGFGLVAGSKMSLDFYQIYFEDEQRKQCYDFTTHYRNEKITDFFENSIISDLVPKSSAEYISVCSWRLRKKRLDGWSPIILKFDNNGDDLSMEKILKEDFDVAVLTPRSGTHKMLHLAAHWHGGPKHNYVWENAMSELKKFIKIPDEVNTAIYENHFIARKELYHEYVHTTLNPVMAFMRGNPVFYAEAGYAEKKERDKPDGPKAVERYRKETGRNDWPIAPFVLERLFSIFINDKKLKIVNL